MTEFLEKINAEVMAILGEECLFSHDDGPHNKTNDLSNSSSKLRGKMKAAGDDTGEEITIAFALGDQIDRAQLGFNAHHILPADAAVNKAKDLLKLMTKQGDGGDLKGDIGYGVNHRKNGVFLPTDDKWNVGKYGKWANRRTVHDLRLRYAYAFWAMRLTGRQFHTGHPDYSRWVLSRLEEIKLKMLELNRDCKQNKCPKKKPWNPPYDLVAKLDSISRHVKSYLTGSPTQWQPPLLTSPESEPYGLGVTPERFLAGHL